MTRRKPARELDWSMGQADRIDFVLDDEHWKAFVELLERPARPMPELAAFLSAPSVLDAASDDADESQTTDG